MFPREQRLGSTRDIMQVLRLGSRRKGRALSCFFLGKPGTLGRVTVIVDTKVSKLAVARNLVKRRVRAILRTIPLPAGDLIIRCYPGITGLDFNQLQAELRQCLRDFPVKK